MGYYRPRPTEARSCQHCGTVYETNHKRTIYCGESCRQLAYQIRHKLRPHKKKRKTKQVSGELEYTFSNITTVATGVIVADGTKALVNAILDVQPTNAQIMEELKLTQQRTEYLLGILSGKLTYAQELTIDVRAGVGAGGNASHKAILASERKRKGLPPGEAEPPKSEPGR